MAEDINKKIKIEAELETVKLEKNITSLNKLIETLSVKQQMLTAAGLQSSAAYENLTSKLDIFQKKLKDVTGLVTENSKSIKDLVTAAKQADTTLSSSAAANTKNTAAINDNSTKVKALGSELKNLDVSVKQQITNVTKSKTITENYDNSVVNLTVNLQQLNSNISQTNNVFNEQAAAVDKNKGKFDVHKATIDALKSSFDKIKDVSGEFAPSLEEAAKGFNALKSGLDIVKTGFTSVGAAIKTTGFGLLVLVLQSIVDYFTKTAEGGRKLSGVLSAIGKVVEIIHKAFSTLGEMIVNAVTHPVESIQALGKMIWQNIINRFTAFGVILDGIIHLDFKKMANGAIQAVTGITDATDKAAKLITTVKKGAENLGGEIADAYKKGTEKAGKAVDDHESKVIQSLKKQIEHYKKLLKAAEKAHGKQKDKECQCDPQVEAGPVTATSKSTVSVTNDNPNDNQQPKAVELRANKTAEDEKNKIKKTALKEIEDYAKKSGEKLATDALKTLQDSIKKQSEAKIAGLEKDKANELSNKSLTSAQRLAIENKYKKKEAAIKVKAFKDEQKASIAQALINGAIAVTKTEAQTGVLGALAIPGIIAQTAIQVAKIAAQKPPAYAHGGYFKSDGKGALLAGYSRTDNTNAYLRSGEAVVVSEAMQVPWARNLVSAINVGFGGRDFSVPNNTGGFAVGGIFTDGGNANRYYNQPVNDQKNLANTIAYQMINNFPPVYVDVKDINNQQNILAQTINRVNL